MAARKRGRKMAKISPQEKKAKAVRNEKRGRTPESIQARQWERKHVVKQHPLTSIVKDRHPASPDRKSRRKRVLEATVEALRRLPAVDDAKASGSTIAPTSPSNPQEGNQDGT